MEKTYHLHHLCLLLISCELTSICPPAGARESAKIHGFCFSMLVGGSKVGGKRLKVLDGKKSFAKTTLRILHRSRAFAGVSTEGVPASKWRGRK